MTKVSKVFKFILPIKKSNYNIGNRYTSIQKYKDDHTQGFRINLIKKESTRHDKYGKVQTTTKHLHLHSKIPNVVRKLIPDAACILTEVSFYNDELIHTSYKNNHFSHDVFNIKIETQFCDENPYPDLELEIHDFSDGTEGMKCFKKMNIEVNNWMMGWIANEIAKDMRKQLIEHHKTMVSTKDEWINTKLIDLDKLEDELFN